mgnify:CR=1 FL=1
MHKKCSAAEAFAAFMKAEDKMGYQVIIPRKIRPSEIHKIKDIPLIGWRYFPSSKNRKRCFCPACISKGEYGVRKAVWHKYDEHAKIYRQSKSKAEKIEQLMLMEDLIQFHKLPYAGWIDIIDKDVLNDAEMLDAMLVTVTKFMGYRGRLDYIEGLIPYALKVSPKTQGEFAFSIMCAFEDRGREILKPLLDIPEVINEIREYDES